MTMTTHILMSCHLVDRFWCFSHVNTLKRWRESSSGALWHLSLFLVFIHLFICNFFILWDIAWVFVWCIFLIGIMSWQLWVTDKCRFSRFASPTVPQCIRVPQSGHSAYPSASRTACRLSMVQSRSSPATFCGPWTQTSGPVWVWTRTQVLQCNYF